MPAATRRADLRTQYRAARRNLSRAEQCQHAAAACRQFMRSPWWLNAKVIGGYVALDGELELAPLFERLHGMGKRLALPVVENRRGAMRFYQYQPGDRLIRNRYGIAEPRLSARPVDRLDLLLVPLVAFDTAGNRLGMGGGYYDRFAARNGGRLIGVAHEVQRAENLPNAHWDRPISGVITEATWQTFAPIN